MRLVYFFLCLPFFCSSQDVSDGLLLHYKLDNNAVDQSTNGFDGNESNITYIDDRFGNFKSASQLDGNSSYIEFPFDESLQPELPVSFSFWVKLNDLDPTNNIFVSTDYDDLIHTGVWMNLSSSGYMAINYGDATGVSSPNRRTKVGTTALQVGIWYYVAGIANGPDDMEIYINCNNDNGSYNGSGGSLTYTGNPGSLGRKNLYYFSGAMDELRYYNRALSEEEALLLCSVTELQISILTSAPPSCKNFIDGLIEVEGNGGIAPYQYSINGGDFQDSNIFDGLDVGIYDIIVKDSQGEEKLTSIILESADEFEIELINISDAVCNDASSGNLEVQALDSNGNSSGFTYSLDAISYQESGLFENLLPGLYTVVVQNSEGCIQEINLSIDNLDAPIITLLSIDPTCLDASDGTIEVGEDSDLIDATFTLNNTTNTTGVFTDLPNGEYELIATGSNGCETSIIVVLDAEEECDEEVLCPLLQNRLGMQINKLDDDRYSLRLYYRDQIDLLESCEYDELFEMIYFHIVNKTSNVITTQEKFESYCNDMDRLSDGDFTPLVERLDGMSPDYNVVEDIELLRSFILTIAKGECVKL